MSVSLCINKTSSEELRESIQTRILPEHRDDAGYNFRMITLSANPQLFGGALLNSMTSTYIFVNFCSSYILPIWYFRYGFQFWTKTTFAKAASYISFQTAVVIIITTITNLWWSLTAPLAVLDEPWFPCSPEVTKALYCSLCATIISIVTIIVTVITKYKWQQFICSCIWLVRGMLVTLRWFKLNT